METIRTQAHADLWDSVREDLLRRLGQDLFERWVAPLTVLSEHGPEISLGAVNRFVVEWVQKRYLATIVGVLRARYGDLVGARLVIDPAQFRQHREDCRGILGLGPGSEAPEALHRDRPDAGARDAVARDPVARDAGGPWPSGIANETSVAEPEGLGASRARSKAAAQTLDTFVVGPSNLLAYNAVQQILHALGALYNPLFLFGPSGVGKTHLLRGLQRVLGDRRVLRDRPAGGGAPRVGYVTGEQFFHQFTASIQDGDSRKFRDRFRSLDVLLFDDVQLLVGKKKTQIEFLHTFSALVESGRQIVIASDVSPKALKELDAGLVTRFLSGLVVGMRKPDFATRLGIARTQAQRLRSQLDDRILEYVAESVRGNARELLGALMKLDIHAQLAGGALSLEEARDVLTEFVGHQARRVDLKRIRDVVAEHFGLLSDDLLGGSRKRRVAHVRQLAMFLARRHTAHSLAEIGKYFGRRNHTTVRCAEIKIARLLEGKDEALMRDVRAILEQLED